MAIQTAFDPALAFGGQAALERWRQTALAVTHRYLDVYFATVSRLADAHVETARAVKLPGLLPFAESHAAIWRDLADAYVTAIRGFIEA